MRKWVIAGAMLLLLPCLVSLLWMHMAERQAPAGAGPGTAMPPGSIGTEAAAEPGSVSTGAAARPGNGGTKAAGEASAQPGGGDTKATENGNTAGGSGYRILVERDDISTYMDLEDYLPGVVACQIGDGHEAETLKCQAIIARTYIRRIMGSRSEVYEEELDIDYLGGMPGTYGLAGSAGKEVLARRLEACGQAVQATRGVTMQYEGRCILPLYHELSAGRTRTGDAQFPYLQSVDSSGDRECEGCLQTFTWSREEFCRLVSAIPGAAEVTPQELTGGIQTVARDDADYLLEMKVGTRTYTGDELRFALGLPSSCFSLECEDNAVRATVRGSGHGYGLSQAGADTMARAGWDCEDILQHYYKNISLISE